jgi:glucan 1,3-beta-glucosidase
MKDNVNNCFGTAPDKGSLTGPVFGTLNGSTLATIHGDKHSRQNSDSYWLSSLGSAGEVSILINFGLMVVL